MSHIPRWVEGERQLLVHGSPIPAPALSPGRLPTCSCHAGKKIPFKYSRSGSFPARTLPFSPQPRLLLGAAGSNYSCVIAELHSAIPARDRCRQGRSSEKRQLRAPSATGNGWEYFSSLSPCPSIPQAPQILTFTQPGRNSRCYLRTVSQGEK